ncbi:uncharacterized protein HKW66_Vig0224190 [Vigna angularis]|uniref:Uncharacterized protein n=2 Tax=Phaseolus angularis TaxID=3914 RepID=A0A8T0K374_PHAAN|nr:uncharacterized protein HKW66_Vig0224190 [Vigna angularis]BAT82459.1 hypothetical protein VIGAN_03247800 [Vigna angularis var. angularis]
MTTTNTNHELFRSTTSKLPRTPQTASTNIHLKSLLTLKIKEENNGVECRVKHPSNKGFIFQMPNTIELDR